MKMKAATNNGASWFCIRRERLKGIAGYRLDGQCRTRTLILSRVSIGNRME